MNECTESWFLPDAVSYCDHFVTLVLFMIFFPLYVWLKMKVNCLVLSNFLRPHGL